MKASLPLLALAFAIGTLHTTLVESHPLPDILNASPPSLVQGSPVELPAEPPNLTLQDPSSLPLLPNAEPVDSSAGLPSLTNVPQGPQPSWFQSKIQALKTKFTDTTDSIKAGLSKGLSGLGSAVGKATATIGSAMEAGKEKLAAGLAAISPSGFKDRVGAWLGRLRDGIKDKVSAFRKGLADKVEGIRKGIADRVSGLKTALKDRVEAIKRGVQGNIQSFKDKVKAKIEELKTKAVAKAQEGLAWAKDKVHQGVDLVKGKIAQGVQGLKDKVKQTVQAIKDKIHNTVEGLKDKARATIQRGLSKICSNPNLPLDLLAPLCKGYWAEHGRPAPPPNPDINAPTPWNNPLPANGVDDDPTEPSNLPYVGGAAAGAGADAAFDPFHMYPDLGPSPPEGASDGTVVGVPAGDVDVSDWESVLGKSKAGAGKSSAAGRLGVPAYSTALPVLVALVSLVASAL